MYNTEEKNIYITPQMELVEFDTEDIITTSIVEDEDETGILPW